MTAAPDIQVLGQSSPAAEAVLRPEALELLAGLHREFNGIRQQLFARRAARQAIFELIEVFYNRQRRHSALGYLSPVTFEAQLADVTEQEVSAA